MNPSSSFFVPLPAQPMNPQVTPRDPGVKPSADSEAGQSFAALVSEEATASGRPSLTPGNRADVEGQAISSSKRPVMEDRPAEASSRISIQFAQTDNSGPDQTPVSDTSVTPVQTSETPIADKVDPDVAAEEAADTTHTPSEDVSPVIGTAASSPDPEVSNDEPFGQTVRQNTPAQSGLTPSETGVTPSGRDLPEQALKPDAPAEPEAPAEPSTVVTDETEGPDGQVSQAASTPPGPQPSSDENPVPASSSSSGSVSLNQPASPEVGGNPVSSAVTPETEEALSSSQVSGSPAQELVEETTQNSPAPTPSQTESTQSDAKTVSDAQTVTDAQTVIAQAGAFESDERPDQAAAPQVAAAAKAAATVQERPVSSEAGSNKPDVHVANTAPQSHQPTQPVPAPQSDLKGDNRSIPEQAVRPDAASSAKDGQVVSDEKRAPTPSASAPSSSARSDTAPASNASSIAMTLQTAKPMTAIPMLVPDHAMAPDALSEAGLDQKLDSLMQPLRTEAALTKASGANPASHLATRMSPAHVQTVAAKIAQRFSEGTRVFDIRMDPPELGRVDVRLELGPDNRVSAIMTAERSEALAELQRSARDLARGLAEAGLDLAEDGLTFQLGHQSGENGQDGEPNGWQRSSAPVFAETDTSNTLILDNPGQSYGFALKSRASLNVQI